MVSMQRTHTFPCGSLGGYIVPVRIGYETPAKSFLECEFKAIYPVGTLSDLF